MQKIKSLFLVLTLSIFLTTCSDTSTNQKEISLEELYKNAVNDAIIAESNEKVDNLIAINNNNNYIRRKVINGKNLIQVLTFTKYRNSYPVGDTIQTSWGETWVTVSPELYDYFKQKNISNDSILNLRIHQCLGLPYDNSYKYIVEMWVDPDSLFRPSPDNEINDSSADLEFPENISDEYRSWFNNNILNSYFPSTNKASKYPWTRLGYTYNWAFGENEIGLSEFVIKRNTKVIISFNGTAFEYFNN